MHTPGELSLFEDFDELVQSRYQSALALHGDLGVDCLAFETHLKCISDRFYRDHEASQLNLVRFVQSLHTNDLMLALSCARGSNAGWQRFSTLYRRYLTDQIRRLTGIGPDPQELGDAVWIDLFLPDRSGQSRIASYDGRSSLATWLRVVVSNRMINERLRKGSRLSNLSGIPEPADAKALHDVESRLRVNRYREMILSCFERALQRLSTRDRLVLLLRYDQELQLGQIARLFSVHQANITRQIDRVMDRLRNDLRDLLAEDHGLGSDAVQECLSVAVESLTTSVSILSLLRSVAKAEDAQDGPAEINTAEPKRGAAGSS
jgi:RNA polymerase sigma-70 factor